jgi:hypothetical protein
MMEQNNEISAEHSQVTHSSYNVISVRVLWSRSVEVVLRCADDMISEYITILSLNCVIGDVSFSVVSFHAASLVVMLSLVVRFIKHLSVIIMGGIFRPSRK